MSFIVFSQADVVNLAIKTPFEAFKLPVEPKELAPLKHYKVSPYPLGSHNLKNYSSELSEGIHGESVIKVSENCDLPSSCLHSKRIFSNISPLPSGLEVSVDR